MVFHLLLMTCTVFISIEKKTKNEKNTRSNRENGENRSSNELLIFEVAKWSSSMERAYGERALFEFTNFSAVSIIFCRFQHRKQRKT